MNIHEAGEFREPEVCTAKLLVPEPGFNETEKCH
jgi:hypothetical protein